MEFAAQQDAGESWQLVDVREAWEIEIASLPHSIHITLAESMRGRSKLIIPCDAAEKPYLEK